MKRFLLTLVLFLHFCASVFAAYPYDSVCQLLVRSGNKYNGGSGTLIATSETEALILSCKHVCMSAGREVRILWPATGEEIIGRVLQVGDGDLDIALVICQRPKELRAVPVTYPNVITSGKLTNAGFPGCTGVLEWQQGKLESIGFDTIVYHARPIPGMSGGATFDQYGNLVGVIVAYGSQYGYSTSGKAMGLFLADYMITHKVHKWEAGRVQEDVKLETPPEESKIKTPKDYEDFKKILEEDYGVVPEEDKAVEEETELPKAANTHSYTCPRHNSRARSRRIFRRPIFRRRH